MKPAEVERLLSYLDGELDGAAAGEFEAEAARDRRLAAETAALRSVFAGLRALRRPRPRAGFASRVVAGWHVQSGARAKWSVRPSRSDSLVRDPFGAFAEGALSRRQARILADLAGRDSEIAAALAAARRLQERLAGLPGFRPSEGFAERVASRARAAAPAPSRESVLALAWLRRACWPRAERRLAFASGLAAGPVAVVAATAYMVFSRPMATLSNVSTFAWNKASAAVSGVAESVTASALARSASGSLEGLGGWAPVVGAGLVAAAALSLLSAWVLYKNVVTANGTEGKYASA